MSGSNFDGSAGAPRRPWRALVLPARLAASLLAVSAPAAFAAGPGAHAASLGVMVVVPSRAIVRALREPSTLDVSADDIRRGFVDVADATELSVQSDAEGFAIDVWPRVALFSAAVVSTPDGGGRIGAEGGSVVQRHRATRASRDVRLGFRFYLNAGVTAGRYAWPVAVAVRPL